MSQKIGISFNYKKLLKEIDSCRARSKHSVPVSLIAVSKKQSVDAIEELYNLGHRNFGENYVQELVSKAKELDRRGCRGIRWHFIGHLQTNKVKSLLPWVACIHTLDSSRLAEELAKKWIASGRSGRLPVFIEVNVGKEEAKSGISLDEAAELGAQLVQFPQLELLGLMCIPPADSEPGAQFRALAALGESLRPYSQGMLSMGMSGDYPVAIAEGATHVRIGTGLFGSRITSPEDKREQKRV